MHELRYRFVFGGGAESALATSGHGYLALVASTIALLAMLGLACLVHRIATGRGTAGVRRGRIWLLTAGLLAIFCLQELLEALFATGRVDGLHGVFGDGGWLAVPLSMAVAGGAVAFVRLITATAFSGLATSFIRLSQLEAAPASQPREAPRLRPPLLRHVAG